MPTMLRGTSHGEISAQGHSVPLALRYELARKALHLSSVTIPLAYAAGAPRGALLALLVALLAVAFAVEVGRWKIVQVREHFQRLTGQLLRSHEHHRWAGATWMLLSFAVAVWLLPAAVAIIVMWAVAAGDAVAAIVGKSLGRIRLGRGGKTLEGSIACFVATALGAVFVAGLGPLSAGAAGLAASAAEWPESPPDDNLRIAAAVAAIVLVTRYAIPGY